jgi:hypothetical protein
MIAKDNRILQKYQMDLSVFFQKNVRPERFYAKYSDLILIKTTEKAPQGQRL